MTTAQLVETAVIVSDIPLEDYVHPEDHYTHTQLWHGPCIKTSSYFRIRQLLKDVTDQ